MQAKLDKFAKEEVRMIKRITRKETLDEVVGLITKRSAKLIKQANITTNDDLGHELRGKAWELEMLLQDLESNLR